MLFKSSVEALEDLSYLFKKHAPTERVISSALENELQVAILRKAAVFEQEFIKKNIKKRPKKN